MNYYQLVHRVDDDQEYSMITQLINDDYEVGADYSFETLKPFAVCNNPKLWLEFKIPAKYQILDLIHIAQGSAPKIVVSMKFYNLLKNFNIQPYQAFPIKIHHKKKIHALMWLHFTQSFNYNAIDFKKTTFNANEKTPSWEAKTDGILGEFKINNWQELVELRQQLKNDFWNRTILPKDYLYFQSTLNWDLVFLDFRNLRKLLLVSNRLSKAITEHKLTGIAIEQAPFDIIY